MERRKLKRAVFLNNTVAHHPLATPPGRKKERYNLTRKGRLLGGEGKGWSNTKGFHGRISKRQEGIYCIGFSLGKLFETQSFENAITFDEDLPTSFDLKFLMALLDYSKGKSVVRFGSIYRMLRLLGFPTNKRQYERAKTALLKWSLIHLHFSGNYVWSGGRKRKGFSFESYQILRGFQFDHETGAVKIRIAYEFLKLLKADYAALLDVAVIGKLDGEMALNLYIYLKSFDLHFSEGKGLVRNLKSFGKFTLLSKSAKPFRLKEQIEKALADINNASESDYQAVFEKDLVTFSRIDPAKSSLRRTRVKKRVVV